MEGDSLKLNFEIALEKIDTLSKHNQELMNKVEELQFKIRESYTDTIIKTSTPASRFNNISADADAAMKRYKQFLKKEFTNAKSKQSKGQPV
jgi:thymidylate kinase